MKPRAWLDPNRDPVDPNAHPVVTDERREVYLDGFRTDIARGYSIPLYEAPPWQPIATAPKDGTEILVYSDSMYMARWEGASAHSPAGWNETSDGMPLEGVTHWMPLPPPPEAGS